MIAALGDTYPVTLLCDILDCPRSSFYYQPQPCPEDLALVAAIEDILMRWPFYGYRRVLHQLKRDWDIGETRVRRLLKWMGVTRQVSRVRIQTTDSHHSYQRYPNCIKGVQAKRLNQIWVADITYIRLGRDFIYLAVVLDAFSRAVRGWQVSEYLTCEALTLPALQMALSQGSPVIFHSDQGTQYAAWCHLEPLLDRCVAISMADKGEPAQNGLVERFIRTMKEEHVDYTEYANVQDAIRQLKQWLEIEYMTERIHSSLGYLTPAEFEAAVVSPMVRGFTNLA
jgi:putative transposase